MEIRKGEILGIGGLAGQGKIGIATELWDFIKLTEMFI